MGFHFTQDLKLNVEISVPKWRMFIAWLCCKLTTSFCVCRWLLLQVCATSSCHYTSESLQHSLVSIFLSHQPQMGSDHYFTGDRLRFTVNSSLCYWGQITVLLRLFYLGGMVRLVGLGHCFCRMNKVPWVLHYFVIYSDCLYPTNYFEQWNGNVWGQLCCLETCFS